jgi:hypothetical protein
MELALAGGETGRRGPPQVETVGVPGVLSEVDLGGRWIHRDGFVGVAAQELQGDGGEADVAVAAGGVNFKDVAVVLGVGPGSGARFGLLAGKPGAPGDIPPAQLLLVPVTEVYCPMRFPSASTEMVDVPPLASGS